jgi:ElaB/YqjD/DUF883 family membrane-anchored ribosome-binding protein
MDDTTATPAEGAAAKERFAKAVEEAKAGVQTLGKEAQDRADLYRDKITSTGSEWADQARDKASDLAQDGKARASEAIAGIAKLVADNAGLIDDKLGIKYGNYARSAGQTMQDAAARLDEKDLGELADDAREFVRNSPGVAIGIAAVAGFMVARLFKGSND